MRRTWVAIVVLAAVASAVAVVRPVAPGDAVWSPGRGELRAADGWMLVAPRWSWRPVGLPLRTAVSASSREGAAVTATIALERVGAPARLAPARTAGEGLAGAVSETLRASVATVPLSCLIAGLDEDCSTAARQDAVQAVAVRTGLRAGDLRVTLEPDPSAVSAARLAGVRSMVGTPERRVLLIGLDGADWELLEPLTRSGRMPALARLIERGTSGDLQSITPLLSPLIWTTMATGVGPEEHGILDFVEADPESGTRVPITGRGRRVPALWNIASAAGLEVVVSGWWATWPAEAVNGVLASDRVFFLLSEHVADTPPGSLVFPPSAEPGVRELAQRAEQESDERAVRALLPVSGEAFRAARAAGRGMADPIDGFRRILVGTRTYFGAALQAAEELEPDLTMVYCIGTDEIGHVLAPFLPPPLPGADPAFAEQARTGVERYFAAVDRWIARLVDTCPPDRCAVLIVSDHGFKWGWGDGPDDRPRDFSGVAAATAALWHRPRGVFVAAGSGVEALGRVSESASVYDVAPTVAALLGLPAGEGWRGRPLPGVSSAAKPVVAWPALVPSELYRPRLAGAAPSPEYIAQLKALGYLESGEAGPSTPGATEGELNNLGLVHLEAGRIDEAEQAFRAAIARNPSYASPHYNLRRLYFETGRYDASDQALWAAVERGLRDAAGAVGRAADDYLRQGRQERALALLDEAGRRMPDDPGLTVKRLALLVAAGRCQEAVAVGEEAAARFPDRAPVHAFLGLAAGCAGDAETARAALLRSLELDPDQPRLREALGSLDAGR